MTVKGSARRVPPLDPPPGPDEPTSPTYCSQECWDFKHASQHAGLLQSWQSSPVTEEAREEEPGLLSGVLCPHAVSKEAQMEWLHWNERVYH